MSLSISVTPNPVKEGANVTISGKSNGTVLVGGAGTTKVVKLDANGKATIKAPVEAGDSFVVSDGNHPNPCEVEVDVISTFT